MAATTAVQTERKCSECGKLYNIVKKGVGGSSAYPGDTFEFNGEVGRKGHWFHGAFCSDECYAAAYYEPPYPYGP